MYGREQCVLLRHYLERGLTKAEVARELGVSRRALYNWIAAGQLDRELDEAPVRYSPRPPVARKLDPFRGIVEARLNEFPRLTATRVFDEIRAAGYAGDEVMAAALIDRVLHPCHLINIRGNSYRMRAHADLRYSSSSCPRFGRCPRRRSRDTGANRGSERRSQRGRRGSRGTGRSAPRHGRCGRVDRAQVDGSGNRKPCGWRDRGLGDL